VASRTLTSCLTLVHSFLISRRASFSSSSSVSVMRKVSLRNFWIFLAVFALRTWRGIFLPFVIWVSLDLDFSWDFMVRMRSASPMVWARVTGTWSMWMASYRRSFLMPKGKITVSGPVSLGAGFVFFWRTSSVSRVILLASVWVLISGSSSSSLRNVSTACATSS